MFCDMDKYNIYFYMDMERSATLELNSYARIGKAVITKAIGLQKNYKEVYEKSEDKLNEEKSGCHNCEVCKLKCRFSALGVTEVCDALNEQCRTCSQAVWESTYTTHTKYINEKNRYGYQPTLKVNAIKLFITYHFLQPDSLGFIKNVSVKELAELLDCTPATIRSSNEILSSYEYCYFCNSGISDNHINVYIPEYKNYHKPASEGGRGYLSLSSNMLSELLAVDHLNTLRLTIKGILEVDNASAYDAANPNLTDVTSTFDKLRGFLPSYCKRNVIRKALEQGNAIFQYSFSDSSVTFSMKQEYAKKNMRKAMLLESEQEVKDHVDSLNDVLELANDKEPYTDHERTQALLTMFSIGSFHRYPSLILTNDDYRDLASMCIQYNMNMVKQAISCVYNDYIAKRRPVESFGALTRHYIRNMSVFNIFAS